MIFVTVGHQMPFDRLVRTVDAWAGLRARDDVFAQIGHADYVPTNIAWTASLPSGAFRQRIMEAEAVVSHAGTGTILTALELGTTILVMPRRGALKETRNDHQVATATRLCVEKKVAVAMDESELLSMLDRLPTLGSAERIRHRASPDLLETVTSFIRSSGRRGRSKQTR